MTADRCSIEVYIDGRWRRAAEVRCDDSLAGAGSATRFEYDFDYLDAVALLATDHHAVSCRYPTGYEVHVAERWPAFLLDLIPSGAARRFWEGTLGLPNNESSDWAILTQGGGNPPGNVRIAEAAAAIPDNPPRHAGFARSDVLERADGFMEYARSQGASIAGGSAAGGDAPKFLLREDIDGRWHADGALADARTARSWLVKFPRSPRRADRLVLESEAPYLRVAARVGARVTLDPTTVWERDCLFVPRFDRRQDRGRVVRLGMESLCSLAGVADWGRPIPKEDQAVALARFATDPKAEVRELLLRDLLDVALGNTDNHARNTAVLKSPDGSIALTPLYDFAPMVLDPQGITRVCRWRHEVDGYPLWGPVAETLAALDVGIDAAETKAWLAGLAPTIAALPKTMKQEGVPARVIQTLAPRIARVAKSLEGTR